MDYRYWKVKMYLEIYTLIVVAAVYLLPPVLALLLDCPKDFSLEVAKETNGDIDLDEVEFFLVNPDSYQEVKAV